MIEKLLSSLFARSTADEKFAKNCDTCVDSLSYMQPLLFSLIVGISFLAVPAGSLTASVDWDYHSDIDMEYGVARHTGSEIIFVDPGVANYEVLLEEMSPTSEVIVLDGRTDGIEQIAEALSARSDIDAVHIVSHGNQAELLLGNARLTADSMLQEHSDELKTIQGALSDSADILIYGCSFGQGEVGSSAMQLLASMTDADIAVSDDLTGARAKGGDWQLEKTVGRIQTSSLSAVQWNGLLVAPVLDLDGDDSSGAIGSNYQLDYYEGASYSTARLADDGDVLITDADDTMIESATWVFLWTPASNEYPVIENNYLSANETGTTSHGINFTVSADKTTITFTGSFPLATYQDLFGEAKYFYTANNPDTAPRVFEFTVNDGDGNSNTATTTLTVIPVNDAPVAVDDTFVVTPGLPVNVSPIDNDSDIDGTTPAVIAIVDTDTTVYTLVVGVAQTLLSGTLVTLNADGTLDVELLQANYGVETYSYTISDGALERTATITLEADTDADGISNLHDFDDDNDGIPDSVEGIWDGSTELIDAGGFDETDVLNISPITSVDGITKFAPTVEFQSWGTQGTIDWSQGQYITGSSLSAATSTPAIIDLSPVGTGFGIFSINGEQMFQTVSVVPGESYQLSFYIGTLPYYNGGAQTSYSPNFDITLSGAQDLSGNLVAMDETSLIQYVAADFPALITTADPGGYTQLNPHWELVTLDAIATSSLMELRIKTNTSGTVMVLDDNAITLTSTPVSLADTDLDGRPNYVDIDSDDDGIPDNIEAQSTTAYIAPSGTGTGITDSTSNGLDDNYEVAAGTAGFQPDGLGLDPANSDGGAATPDSTPDYLDLDSDNDTLSDNAENGLGVAMVAPGDADLDTDGLKDVYETVIDGATNDGYIPNEGIADPLITANSYLPDGDADASAGVPLTGDLDYRDTTVTTPASPPVATNDSTSVAADTTASVDLSDNVSDVDGDLDIATIDLDPSTAGIQTTLTTGDGVWNVDALGVVTFNPDADFSGTSTIPYTVSDAAGNVSVAADVSVTVATAPPIATNDAVSVAADVTASVDLADNVSDANGDLVITTIDLDPATAGIQTTLTTTDGVWTVDALGTVSFDPAAAFEGTATIPYTVSDAAGNVSLAADVSVTVAGAVPVATNDATSVAADRIAMVDLADNVSDANGDLVITTIDLDPAAAGVQTTLSTTDGVWNVDALGTVSFDPVAAFEGTATIPYTVSDDDGNVSVAADVSVTVAGATPVATNDMVAVAADTIALVDLADNVSDANGDLDITTIDLDSATAGVQTTLTTVDGEWSVDALGLVSFDPVASFEGTAILPYTVSDVAGNVSLAAEVSVTVAGDFPVATNDSASVAADTIASIDLADNVGDANGDLDITTIDLDPATAGIQTTLTTTDGVWAVDALGTVSFDPVAAFEGTATVPYTVSDAAGNVSLVADVSVTVAGALPVATNDATSVAADTIAMVDLLDNVSDANNDLVITTIDLDPTTAGVQTILTTTEGVWSVDALGMVSFDPVAGYEGTATIAYTISDDNGNVSVAADVSVTVAGALPVATNDATSVAADTIAMIDLADNVSDANGDLVITTIDLDPATAGVQTTLTTTEGVWSVDALGTVSFDPIAAFEGTATIPYTVSDAAGNVSLVADVSVTVAGDFPVATNDSASVAADTIAMIDLADNVSDANGDLVITTIDLDPATAGIQTTLTTTDGVWAVDALGTVSFDPVASFEGTAILPYTVSDVAGNVSLAAEVSVTVAGDFPVATNDSASVAADTIASIDLADSVGDANGDLEITTIDLDPTTPGIQTTLTTADGAWTVDAVGTVSFDPVAAFEGTASISYTVSDAAGNVSLAADVSVTVAGALPVATNDATSVAADTIGTVDLADNVSDANGDLVIATIDLDPAIAGVQTTLTTTDGVWTVDALGTVSFDPAAAFEGTATVPYTVSDAAGNVSVAADVSVTVAGAIPVATNDMAIVAADTIASIDLFDNVADANGDLDIATIDLDPATAGIQTTLITTYGKWAVDALGALTFDPVATFEGTATISYTIADAAGNISAAANVTVNVASASPVADAEVEATVQNTDVTIDVVTGDTDANNDIDSSTIDLDPLTAGIQSTITVAGEGVYTVIAGQVVFNPDADFYGTSSIDYIVSDAAGNTSNSANISVNVLVDTDADGIADVDDLDDDNDGLPDVVEGSADTDGDGVPDSLDLDSDNDGLTDANEAGGPDGTADENGDGIIDGFVDANNDGLDDATAAIPLPDQDSDADGIVDHLDLDSDNDGLTDANEAGAIDADGDGMVDGITDADNDGLDDDIAASPLPDLDSDNDGIVDHLDLDSDNDGIPDVVEAGGVDIDADGYIDGFIDINGDGLDDVTGAAPLAVPDTDADGIADHLDLDSDNDGIPDVTEAGGSDTDGDGVVDGFTDANEDGLDDATTVALLPVHDTDSDGTPDYLEQDSDDDGIPDSVEAGINPAKPIDTDTDGTADYLEQDSDNDGISDSLEAGANPEEPIDTDGDGTPDFLESDSDNDGIPDSIEVGTDPTVPVDTDGDGLPNFLESDSDNDGIPDSVEAGSSPYLPVDTDGDGMPDYVELDSDSDGIADSIEAGNIPSMPVDTDGDGTADYIEADSDNDGIPDAIEAGSDSASPLDTDSDGIPDYLDQDSDNDGIPDMLEAGESPEQPVDTDADGIPDYQELDSDNDGMPDSVEAGGSPNNPIDSDADGAPDYLDLDSDDDGILDSIEAGANPIVPVDTDGNDIPDYRQTANSMPEIGAGNIDSDGDGISDELEGAPDTDTDGDGIPNYLDIDSDNDGLLDIIEAGNAVQPIDTDGDGIADYLDLDSDNDAFTDTQEAGGRDVNGDGVVDNFTDANRDGHDDGVGVMGLTDPDSDGDGIVDHLDIDSDNDGLPDILESSGSQFDLDGDGRVDAIVDANADGLADGIDANGLLDTDSDGTPNHLDLDSDGDDSFDITEAGGVDVDGDGQVDSWSDVDGDGVPDSVDADLTGGEDKDNDGIDDFADVDFVALPDSDGDGIVDTFDDDRLSTGFSPIVSSGALTKESLPDTNFNGVPDVFEINGPAKAQSSGIVHTGLAAHGCSVGTNRSVYDPTLLLLLLTAGGFMVRRRALRTCPTVL